MLTFLNSADVRVELIPKSLKGTFEMSIQIFNSEFLFFGKIRMGLELVFLLARLVNGN